MSDTIPQSIPQKQCKDCLQFFPATTEFFHMHHAGLLRSQCKKCANRIKREKWMKNHPPDILPEGCKRCTHCQQIKSATTQYFFANKGMKDGLNFWCKECRKAWGDKHPEFGYSPTYYRQYAQTHQEVIAQRQRIYLKTESGKASRMRYAAGHQEEKRASVRNRRSRIKAIPGTHTAQDIQIQYQRQKGKCYYCNRPIQGEKYHVDHTIPVTREGARNSIDHLVIACGPCNQSKGNKCPWEWPEGGRLL